VSETETKLLQGRSYSNFINAIKSPASRSAYNNSLKHYLNHLKTTNPEDLLSNTNPRFIESQLIDYIMTLRNDGLAYATMQFLVAPILTFYSLNDVVLNRRKISRYYAQEREMKRIPILIGDGKRITLSPGGQNILIQKILTEFVPMFVPDCKVLYIGDTDKKFTYYDKETFSQLGIEIDPHGKIPDLIIYSEKKNWLLLIEAVTSHGPINAKRMGELRNLFSKSTAGLIFITSFLDRRSMIEYLKDISWETEVWVAESPSHLIHFDGERFLGPYEWKH
jgi:hypothetical protein